MIQFALAVLLAYLTVRAHRSAHSRDERALSFARVRFAAALLTLVAALVPVAFGVTPAARVALLGVGAAAAVVAWEAFAQLLATGTRKRDVGPRAFWLGVAVITLATPAPWGVAAGLGAMGGLAFRWRHAVPTRRKYLMVILAIALAAAGYFRVGAIAGIDDASQLTSLERQLWSVANSIRLALAIVTSFGAWTLLLAIVGDPSLGIRTVGRRLGLSHSLVLLIPMALVLSLWTATTFLGVNRDRATAGARAMDSEAVQLHAGLLRAVAQSPEAVAALATTWDGVAPGVRAFLFDGGRATRLAGDSLEGAETATSAWVDSLATMRGGSLVSLDGQVWVGAVARGAGRTAVILVPADSLVSRTASSVAGGPARISPSLMEADRGTKKLADVTVSDSAEVVAERAESAADSADQALAADTADARPLPRNRPHASLSVGNSRYRMDEQDLSARQFFLEGHAFIPAYGWKGSRWHPGQLMLSVALPPGDVLWGMFRNTEDDPMGFVPMIMLVLLGGLMALVALWDILMVTSMSRGVATAIGALRDAARKLEGGDLTHRIELRGDDDLWEVARAVNQAAEGLEKAQAAEKDRARMESELAVARRIQSRLLPAAAPRIPGLEIAGTSQPALEVGGDYFDHIDMGDGRVALVIADVSGKGVPAALLMSAFRAALVSHDLRREEPAALAERLNDFLHRSVDPGKFVTAFIAFLDSATGELQFVNAGHNPSLLTRADGTHEWLSEGGTILGILPMSVFTAGRVTLQTGDVLTLYTDGVTEGADATKEQWGEDRLVAALQRLREEPCAEIARALVTEVRTFEGDSGPADDITVIVARRA